MTERVTCADNELNIIISIGRIESSKTDIKTIIINGSHNRCRFISNNILVGKIFLRVETV